MKILNLYCGIGGNRKLWGDEHEITAVEIEPKIAKIYEENFPNDTVIIADAHQYLLDHHKEFDFIWSSPPCPTHSGCNNFLYGQGCIRYPDMKLWQEIIFLNHFCKNKFWCVENVKSYYPPVLNPIKLGRHFIWSNFNIEIKEFKDVEIGTFNRQASKEAQTKVKKTKLERNCVNKEIGLHILKSLPIKRQPKSI